MPPLNPLVLFAACLLLGATGDEVLPDVPLRTAEDAPTTLPSFGKLTLVVFYTDADVAEMNDPLADALAASAIPKTEFEGFGVVNLKDSKAPNFIIRAVMAADAKKYDTVIVADPDLALARAWRLGDCNETSVVVVVGTDKKVKYLKKGPVRGAEIAAVVSLVSNLVAQSADGGS